MTIEPLTTTADPDWLHLRLALWPEASADEHLAEMTSFVAEPSRFAQFIARSPERGALGFAEASIRRDPVSGTDTSPVAFLEGLYVAPGARRRGVARGLVEAVARWGASRGCTELASDTQLDNTTSQAMHLRLGFVETERVVAFKRRI